MGEFPIYLGESAEMQTALNEPHADKKLFRAFSLPQDYKLKHKTLLHFRSRLISDTKLSHDKQNICVTEDKIERQIR